MIPSLRSTPKKLHFLFFVPLALSTSAFWYLNVAETHSPTMAASRAIPTTMKAWTYSKKGQYRDVLRLNTIPAPKPPTGHNVLVKIAYAALSTGEAKIMRQMPQILIPKNSIPAIDYSGVIVETGPSAPANLHVGDRVFGMLEARNIMQGIGVLCEYINLDPKRVMVAPVPENVSLKEASALGASANVAYLICKHGSILPGNNYRVLVNGASGTCGSVFVQGVLAMGAKEVVGTCSAANAELVMDLGASRVIDYRANAPLPEFLSKEYGELGEQFDFILDTVGSQDLYTNSPKYLREGGVFVNLGAIAHGPVLTTFHWFLNTIRPTWLGGTPRKFVMFSGNVDLESADWIVRHTAAGKLKSVIENMYEFEKVLEAYDLVEAGKVRGKLVVKVGEVAVT
jgi:NADPH:quinone reductase-like Zn-dependent oxidoreductase